nr:putative nuclease HARBI1 [Penaeus vannamei]
MPYVLGAIDGCHVKVKAPSRMQADYLDRTLHHSVTLLAVCDVEKRFTFISAGFPGSAHDSRVFKNSVLYEKIKKEPSTVFPTQKHYIIGDSAFPLLEHLLVPFRKSDNLACNRKKFNKVLSQTRVVVEHSFGLLKGRFRKLRHLDVDIDRAQYLITACCVLHNLTICNHEEIALLEQEIIKEEHVHEETEYDNDQNEEGEMKREMIVNIL